MAKAEVKTRPTDVKVEDFLNTIDDEQKREDSFTVMQIMTKLSGDQPKMWGPAIVGFGSHMLKYASGAELEWPDLAFSARKAGLTIYFADGFADEFSDLLGKLGKHTTSKCCLYIKRLSDVDVKVLTQMIKASLKQVKKRGQVAC